jgi:hypothetical protein
MTGRSVLDAMMPGSAAESPAIAMKTLQSLFLYRHRVSRDRDGLIVPDYHTKSQTPLTPYKLSQQLVHQM